MGSIKQSVALKVLKLAIRYHIVLEPEWLLNEQVDYLSRTIDWFLNPVVFAELDAAWGPHTVNRFADFHNRQTPRFNSRCWNPAVDVNWRGGWCPSIKLIPRVIGHVQVCRAVGTLVVPCWLSAPFCHSCIPQEGYARFVTGVAELPLSELLILPGLSGSSLLNSQIPNTAVLARRCNFGV